MASSIGKADGARKREPDGLFAGRPMAALDGPYYPNADDSFT